MPQGLGWVVRVAVVVSCCAPVIFLAQETTAPTKSTSAPATHAKTFDTPQAAADALITAASNFDVGAMEEIFGRSSLDVVFTGELPQDRERVEAFVAEAREKKSVSMEPKSGTRAFLLVGNEDWPFPVPIVKSGSKWFFDTNAGRQELLYRRIGSNELDAIQISRGYVEAQHDYAMKPREGYDVNQYAQRIISTPGTQDGLAWRNADGSIGGPIGEKVAEAIAQGYNSRGEPYHGYFFKVLKGQGPAAPKGQMDYMVKGIMIGGFALVAAPAEYRVTGVKTFMVSQDGVVYQKDLGPTTLEQFKNMERFNPDASWTPVPDESD
jgi:Protein of unknown function (DUF2950)